ncbi:hypothetical protein BCR36DRAFT_369978 [Piromyces finnis]|uniref:Uncharacterized protein n=1 Tax=Piromyces finnis TaxID=1754191 RepID=A0A1Y1VA90_9FUNG|nr:hypothetical protein BCR36DRAFT_369978 [Piromyces finnis]|eukprot:ORX51029.1 hypothetical protein BCR36DRAFT_369978 [Piromyces finnis]
MLKKYLNVKVIFQKERINNENNNDIYVYPIIITSDKNELNNFITDFVAAVKSEDYMEIDLPTANQYDKSKNPDIDNYPNVSKDLINDFIEFCRNEQSYKSIFDDVKEDKLNSRIYKEIQISIDKTTSDDIGSLDHNPRYHLIVNNVKNDKVIRAITVKEVNSIYEHDESYSEKVLYYYNHITLYKDYNFQIDDFSNKIYKIAERKIDDARNINDKKRKEIKENPNGSAFYDDIYIPIEDEIRGYLKDKNIDHLTEQQIQR